MSKGSNAIRRAFFLICLVSLWLIGTAVYHTHKPIPENLNYRGQSYLLDDSDIEFLSDLTYSGPGADRLIKQEIFDTIFETIDHAGQYILIDMFLFNPYGADSIESHRSLSTELTDKLVEKKASIPSIAIDFITDPINTVYGGAGSVEIERLQEAGINVIVTDLHRLRDSNYLYSSLWRTFLQWFSFLPEPAWLTHPFGSDTRVTLSGYLDLINFKANHRKVMIGDSGNDMVTIVTSANPHDGSSAHSNVGLALRGDIWRSVYDTEMAIARMSGGELSSVSRPDVRPATTGQGDVELAIVTERQIKRAIIDACERSGTANSLKIAQFYLSDRQIVNALLEASDNGAGVKIILDPNKDAFGYEKNGIPNRQAAGELRRRSAGRVEVRWYDTHGEQFHTKLFIRESDEQTEVITGSANLTRRNLDNFNLEIGVRAVFDSSSGTAREIRSYFDRIWFNQHGYFTVEFDEYRDEAKIKRTMYLIQEAFGLGTF